ncbi:MAG TPA: IS1182 family transposase [Stellaceae bacterium]|jgi:transposase
MSDVHRRLRFANRSQQEMRTDSVDQLLPPEHPARDVWEFVGRLDLSELLKRIRSLPGRAGAPAIDPRVLLSLWLYATSQGVGSARALAELCQNHLVYRWLSGNLEINYHTLSDFRTGQGEFLNTLLTQMVATMMHQGLIDLKRVAQDGMKVRAAAGGSSFRRPASIEKCMQEAQAQVEALRRQDDEDTGGVGRRQQAARERAAADRLARLEAAQRELGQLRRENEEKRKERRKPPDELRCSTTDPEARKMKMADGGFRPAYNVQLATATDGGVIVGVAVTQAGHDAEQMTPMLGQLHGRYGRGPAEMLADGGFVNLGAIDAAHADGTAVYAPVKEPDRQRAEGRDPYAPKPGDKAGTIVWRARMGTEAAQKIYQERAGTAEWVNAQLHNHGLTRFRLRGITKVLSEALWQAVTHNLQRLLSCQRRPAFSGAA